jgi:predicted alpha/beta-hydrolase family hydrolase
MSSAELVHFPVPNSGNVSALLLVPPTAHQLLVLAHGAGAGMQHSFMESLATALADVHVATFRYQFPYMEQHRHVPDSPAVLTSTVIAAVATAHQLAPSLPLFAGGKSMGGRLTSQAAAKDSLAPARGIVFFGFPLHPPKRPSTKRADHLAQVKLPMLFLQGTRDTLADLTLLRPICGKLGPLATLHIIDSADHAFHVLKRSGKTDSQVLQELAQTTAAWATSIAAL